MGSHACHSIPSHHQCGPRQDGLVLSMGFELIGAVLQLTSPTQALIGRAKPPRTDPLQKTLLWKHHPELRPMGSIGNPTCSGPVLLLVAGGGYRCFGSSPVPMYLHWEMAGDLIYYISTLRTSRILWIGCSTQKSCWAKEAIQQNKSARDNPDSLAIFP